MKTYVKFSERAPKKQGLNLCIMNKCYLPKRKGVISKVAK